nr:DNA-directed RNA polymerase subunit delta [Geomicrobium halophilum]
METSTVELAYLVLKEKREPILYKDLFTEIVNTKEIDEDEMDERRTKLYTSLNTDGRFVHLGANHWGLKAWYSVDKSEDDLGNTFQPTPRGNDDQESENMEDDLEDLEDELDELANEEDEDTEEKDDFEGFGQDDEGQDEEDSKGADEEEQ